MLFIYVRICVFIYKMNMILVQIKIPSFNDAERRTKTQEKIEQYEKEDIKYDNIKEENDAFVFKISILYTYTIILNLEKQDIEVEVKQKQLANGDASIVSD